MSSLRHSNARILIAALSFLQLINAPLADTMTTQFSSDLKLLNSHFSAIVLTQGDNQKLAVLPELQGRVMMGSLSGDTGESIGWFNRSLLTDPLTAPIDGSVGGAERLWFGPDGGEYSLFFDAGVERVNSNIRPPVAVNSQPYRLTKRTTSSANFAADVSFNNINGFIFKAHVEREVSLIPIEDMHQLLNLKPSESVKFLGYSSQTRVTNTSNQAWTPTSGLFSIWNLSMLSPPAVVVLPLKASMKQKLTPYFENTSRQRQWVEEKTAFYLADAKRMDKIGIPVNKSLAWFGSYNPEKDLLTLIQINPKPTDSQPYVNAVWRSNSQPLEGESINVFNGGPQAGGHSFNRFYELESSSPALILKPNMSQMHTHTTLNFQGDDEHLSLISRAVLGVSIKRIKQLHRAMSEGTAN